MYTCAPRHWFFIYHRTARERHEKACSRSPAVEAGPPDTSAELMDREGGNFCHLREFAPKLIFPRNFFREPPARPPPNLANL